MLSLCLAAALAFTPEDAAFASQTAKAFVSDCTPRDAGTVQGGQAANWLLARASRAGADVRRDVFKAPTPAGLRRFANVYGDLAVAPTGSWVVVVSHFDTKPNTGCPGANDGASTSALLVALARILSRTDALRTNVMLVWTDGEECQRAYYTAGDGFQGSQRAAEFLKEKKRNVRAVLCLDMLGDRDLHIDVPANGTPELARLACAAAERIGEPGLVKPSENLVKDDHVAFLREGYRAIDLIDFEYGPDNAWWHTPEDTCDKLSEDSFLKTGRLVCEMLNMLQQEAT